MSAERTGPLSGVRVIELAGIGPGPYAGMLLDDLGAEVIRVERPGGNPLFDLPHRFLNRGRRSVALNLKADGAAEVILRLVKDADVLIEGFRPGVTERLGIGPDECLAVNPRLVYGRMTGWGQDGPLAQVAGHDITYLALSGALRAIGPAGAPPVPPINLLGDFGAGGLAGAAGMAGRPVQDEDPRRVGRGVRRQRRLRGAGAVGRGGREASAPASAPDVPVGRGRAGPGSGAEIRAYPRHGGGVAAGFRCRHRGGADRGRLHRRGDQRPGRSRRRSHRLTARSPGQDRPGLPITLAATSWTGPWCRGSGRR